MYIHTYILDIQHILYILSIHIPYTPRRGAAPGRQPG